MKINYFGLIYFNFLVSVVCALTISAHVFYLVMETQYPNPRMALGVLFIFGFFLWQLLTRYKEQEGHGFAFITGIVIIGWLLSYRFWEAKIPQWYEHANIYIAVSHISYAFINPRRLLKSLFKERE